MKQCDLKLNLLDKSFNLGLLLQFQKYLHKIGSPDSIVSLGTGLDGPQLKSRQGQEIFISSKTFRLTLGPTQPQIQWITFFFPRNNVARA
jgi:hypothetical protein